MKPRSLVVMFLGTLWVAAASGAGPSPWDQRYSESMSPMGAGGGYPGAEPPGGWGSRAMPGPGYRDPPYRRGMPPDWGPPPDGMPGRSELDGVWRGSGGDVVVIRGNRARLYGGEKVYCDCVFMIYGNRLIAYSPQTDITQTYIFEVRGDRLVVQDERGQTMVYERRRQERTPYPSSRW